MKRLIVSITYPHNGFTSVDMCHPHGSIATALYYRDPFQNAELRRLRMVGPFIKFYQQTCEQNGEAL